MYKYEYCFAVDFLKKSMKTETWPVSLSLCLHFSRSFPMTGEQCTRRRMELRRRENDGGRRAVLFRRKKTRCWEISDGTWLTETPTQLWLNYCSSRIGALTLPTLLPLLLPYLFPSDSSTTHCQLYMPGVESTTLTPSTTFCLDFGGNDFTKSGSLSVLIISRHDYDDTQSRPLCGIHTDLAPGSSPKKSALFLSRKGRNVVLGRKFAWMSPTRQWLLQGEIIFVPLSTEWKATLLLLVWIHIVAPGPSLSLSLSRPPFVKEMNRPESHRWMRNHWAIDTTPLPYVWMYALFSRKISCWCFPSTATLRKYCTAA